MTDGWRQGEHFWNAPEWCYNWNMPSNGSPTIVDVARAAGVSKSLVSLAIRNDAGVSAATRERILKVADEIGYRSNHWARSLVAGRTNLVGVLLNDLGNAYNTDIVDAIEDAAALLGLSVVISHGRRTPDVLAARLESLMRLGLDGFVVVSAHTPPRVLADAARSAPVVVIGNPRALPDGVSQVRGDDEAGARLAVEHLLSRGHERVAYLAGSTSKTSRIRAAAYREAMETHGLAPQEFEDVEFVGADADADVRPTAVFASNDRTAARLMGRASDAGLRMPEDLAVVGYDDTELATLLRPQLTSVAQPRAEMGRRALEILTSGDVAREVLAPELVVRASS